MAPLPPDSQLITLTRKVSCWKMVWVHSRGETAHPDHTLPHTIRSAPDAQPQPEPGVVASINKSPQGSTEGCSHHLVSQGMTQASGMVQGSTGQGSSYCLVWGLWQSCQFPATAAPAPTAWPWLWQHHSTTQAQAAEVQNKLSHAKALETGQ